MNVFISYARRDQPAVIQLRSDITELGHPVWLDREVTGGHQWWSTILQQIRSCDVFVFAVSAESLKSKACLSELHYAQALRRTILPIMVAEVDLHLAPEVVANTQIVSYTNRTTEAAFALLKAFNGLPAPGPLPTPLPPEPEVPASYLNTYLERLEAPELGLTAQMELFVQLRARLDDEDERETVHELLARLRRRPDLAQSLVEDLDEILAPQPGERRQEVRPPAPRTPPAPPRRVVAPPPRQQESAPMATPEPEPRRSPMGWIVGAAAVVAAGAVILAVVLANGSGTDPDGGSEPSSAVEIPITIIGGNEGGNEGGGSASTTEETSSTTDSTDPSETHEPSPTEETPAGGGEGPAAPASAP